MPEIVGAGQRGADEGDGRETGQLRHAPHLVVADRPQARDRRGGALGRGGDEEARASTTLQTCDTVTGRRVPTPTKVCNAVAIQRGTERPNDVVIITGHIDSRVTDPMNATKDAPGANDDGSGTAAVMEAARVLSKHKFPGTIVYAALSGEEQGLLGGKILADYAKAQGWNVIANLNNDIIGNSCGSDGVCDDKHGARLLRRPALAGRARSSRAQMRSQGGENDRPSRNISRFLDRLAERLPSIGLDVMQIWRNDRFGRGGDHTEFLNAGFPAVRFSVAVENYNCQHQDLRTENGIEYRRHHRQDGFPLSGEGHQAERRRAGRARQRPAAARADGRGGGEHGYDGQLGAGRRSAARLCGSLAPNRCQPMGASAVASHRTLIRARSESRARPARLDA